MLRPGHLRRGCRRFGRIAGFAVVLPLHRCQQKQAGLSLAHTSTSSWSLAAEMVRLAVPVSFGAVVLPLVQMLDAVIVPGRLLALNYSTPEATALLRVSGRYGCGFDQPAYHFYHLYIHQPGSGCFRGFNQTGPRAIKRTPQLRLQSGGDDFLSCRCRVVHTGLSHL